ncbi:MAG TPA: hypothetical protein PKX91_04775 [Clostridia bacterium]|jgi:hypothetical protein|nr:hypothetical protein [Clostridia bacterium]
MAKAIPTLLAGSSEKEVCWEIIGNTEVLIINLVNGNEGENFEK